MAALQPANGLTSREDGTLKSNWLRPIAIGLIGGLVLFSAILFSNASATHNISWMTKTWVGTYHGTLYQQGGFDFHHFSSERWRGRGYDFGDGRVFDKIRIYVLAAVSCTNGATWFDYTNSYIVTFYDAITAYTATNGDLPIPSCVSSPKYWVRVCGWWTDWGATIGRDWNFFDAGSGSSHGAC